jgi:GDP-L-fucose synthase
MAKIHHAVATGATSVPVWGSGTPRREFLHVDDLADACVFLLAHYDDDRTINVGTGTDIAIRTLAAEIARVVGFTGTFTFDATKPDGTPRKLLDVSRLAALGWQSRIPLRQGLETTYRWYKDQLATGTVRGNAGNAG